MTHIQDLTDAGQSIWLDNIRKALISEGILEGYIRDLGVTGVTSNPTILEKAVADGAGYDDAIRDLLANGITAPEAIAFAIALDDLGAAADLLRPVFEATGGLDGYVSIEVPPDLLDDPDGTVAAGERLFAQANRPNVMIKVPGTAHGLRALETLISEGIPVNVTLLFSAEQYEKTAQAYLRGLDRRRAEGKPLAVGSVASVFVSRWDAATDPRIPAEHRGSLGVHMMQRIYAAYRRLLDSERWHELAADGALPQRVLWASTSTKDPDLPDTYYLGKLAAPGTVNTVPELTLLAYADHGSSAGPLAPDVAHADNVIAGIERHGVDTEALAAELQAQGAAAFSASWNSLLDRLSLAAGRLDGA